MAGDPEEPVLLLKVQGTVTGLALDWIHNLLYWTNAEGASLHVGLLDGSAQRTLITGLDRPSAVAVDPLHRCRRSASLSFISIHWQLYLLIYVFFSLCFSQASLLGPMWRFCKDYEIQPGRSGQEAFGHLLDTQPCGSVSG